MNAPPIIRQSSSSSSQLRPQPSASMEMLLVTSGQAARSSRHIQPEGPSTVGLRVRRQRPALSISTPSSEETLRPPRDFGNDVVPSVSTLGQMHRLDNPKRWPATGPQEITAHHTLDLRVGPPPPWGLDETASAPRRANTSQFPTSPRSPGSRAFTRAWKNVCGALRKPERENSIPHGFVVVSPQTPTAPHRP